VRKEVQQGRRRQHYPRLMPGKERQARISEGTLQEWQETVDGGRVLISQPKKRRRRKRLRKHNGFCTWPVTAASTCAVVVFMPEGAQYVVYLQQLICI
jgi:hypothetical protein